jgi:hypothetical protein
MPTFRLTHDNLQDNFLKSRAKVQLYGGGFGNGKTSGACIKALEIARDYPGCNGLMARSTYPKLNDTLRKEFLKWCPKHWIKSFPMSANGSNTCTLKNGSMINFRYIAQQGKSSNDATTSNQLSATYDWCIVDQMEDPEIVHKDFLDLLGRLRGATKYAGKNKNMPKTGPRWLIGTMNPTRGWCYRKLVKPIHDFNRGKFNPDLLCETDENGKPVLTNGIPVPLIELFEGSTYENKDNLEPDFIEMLEASYKGQMRDRFLLGEWAAYEGLVYPDFDENVHVLSKHSVEQHYKRLNATHHLEILEGFDFGIAVQSCYLFAFVDGGGNIFFMDGFYEPELSPEQIDEKIKAIRVKYGAPTDGHVMADPDLFKRRGTVGFSLAHIMLNQHGIFFSRGNSDISNGIIKVGQYLIPQRFHQNPITGEYVAPYLYVADNLEFVIDEFTSYYWKRNPQGELLDKPVDKDDHAMDTIKYMLSHRPSVASIFTPRVKKQPGWFKWGDRDIEDMRDFRHGR